MLNHIGLSIFYKEDVYKFYVDLLGFSVNYTFGIDKDKSLYLFKLNAEAEVFVLEKNELKLELFYTRGKRPDTAVYSHLCIEVEIEEALTRDYYQSKGYDDVRIIERKDREDLFFVSDRSGNLFEIKPAFRR